MAANVRIPLEAYRRLRELAAIEDRSMAAVLSEAIDGLYRKRFIERANRAYARLKDHSVEWKEELRERRVWETTLQDGLD